MPYSYVPERAVGRSVAELAGSSGRRATRTLENPRKKPVHCHQITKIDRR